MAAQQLHDTLPAPTGASRDDSPLAPRWTVLPRLERDGDGSSLVHERRLRYEPERVVGEGGMGEVWLARDNDIGRRVALKRLRPEMAGDRGLARFADEVRIAGRLEHPNIAPLHDVGVDETGNPYFVMKLIEGEGLDRVITRLQRGDPHIHAAWPVERRVEVVRGILLALAHAHAQGLVHRDVKPGNVMIGDGGEVVLTDWGIARAMASRASTDGDGGEPMERAGPVTQQGSIVGTPLYMAPEQAGIWAEDGLDGRADVYAVGVILHELITLRHHMEGVSDVAGVVARLHDPRTPGFGELMRSHRAADRVPPELIHVARRAMQRQPSLRYQSAGDMLRALDAVREGRMAVQCHATLTKRSLLGLSRWVDRSPMGAPAALWMGALGLASGAGYALWTLLSGAM